MYPRRILLACLLSCVAVAPLHAVVSADDIDNPDKNLFEVLPDRVPDGASRFQFSSEGRSLLATLKKEKWKFTPAVRANYIRFARSQAREDLAKMNKTLPADFLRWVESTPYLASSVYGSRARAADVLVMLYSLELDLGREIVRGKYMNLALASAIVSAGEAANADLTPRKPMQLVIPGDPRKPVDTKDATRTLDRDDHIVNFFKDHAPIEAEMLNGMKQALPELVYDEKGVAKSYNEKKGKSSKGNLVKRDLVPADVLASRALQQEFNAYMKAKGFDVNIDCGDKVIYPMLGEMIIGPEGGKIREAYVMFRDAFIKKGLLAAREAPATPAERCLYAISKDTAKKPPSIANRNLPTFPLNAPWPTLTLYVAEGQPLREREDLYRRLVDNGEFHTYGEYIGPIAQQYDFQSARRLTPYAYGYGSVQMMLKDGGVCGTMATIATRTYNMLGVPSTTAGQPGHCALITYIYNPDTKKYDIRGEQYVTGEHEHTHPHQNWYFGDVDQRRPMAYHLSSAWAVNAGTQAFLDGTIAHLVARGLDDADRAAHATAFLETAIASNPFNFNVVDGAINNAATVDDVVRVVKTTEASVKAKAKQANCEADGLYIHTVYSTAMRRIGQLKGDASTPEGKALVASMREGVEDYFADIEIKKAKRAAAKASGGGSKKRG